VTLTHVEIGVEESRHLCYEMNDEVFDSDQNGAESMTPFAV